MLRVCVILSVILPLVGGRALRCAGSSDSSDTDAQDSSGTVRARDPTSDGHDSSAQGYVPRLCDGRGVRYCNDNYAVTADECPDVCRDCDESSSDNQDAIAREELFDFVYVSDGGLCLSGCNDLDKMTCGDWDSFEGETYCKYVSCSPGTGINGCHSRSDFKKPSCRVCATVFPRACSADRDRGGESSSGDSSDGGWAWDRFVSYNRVSNWTGYAGVPDVAGRGFGNYSDVSGP